MRVNGGSVTNALRQALNPAQRARFKNVERLLFARDQIRKVAAAAIDAMHEQAHAIRVSRLGSSGVLFQESPEPVGIARLQEFEGALEICHECLRVLGLVSYLVAQQAD